MTPEELINQQMGSAMMHAALMEPARNAAPLELVTEIFHIHMCVTDALNAAMEIAIRNAGLSFEQVAAATDLPAEFLIEEFAHLRQA